MKSDTAVALGVVAMIALCCGGPLILSLLASGALLGALAAVWSSGRVALLGGATILVLTGVWLVARRRTSSVGGGADWCALPGQASSAAEAATVAPRAPDSELSEVEAARRSTGRQA